MMTEKQLMERVFNFKNDVGYKCIKCGNDRYKKGKVPYARRCTKCDYDESITKATVLENSKLTLYDIYRVLMHLEDEAEAGTTEKVIGWKKRDGSIEDLSYEDIMDRYKGGQIEGETADMLFKRYLYRINIPKLSEHFSIESNSLNKFFDKLAKRAELLGVIDEGETESGFDKIWRYYLNNKTIAHDLLLVGLFPLYEQDNWNKENDWEGLLRKDNAGEYRIQFCEGVIRIDKIENKDALSIEYSTIEEYSGF